MPDIGLIVARPESVIYVINIRRLLTQKVQIIATAATLQTPNSDGLAGGLPKVSLSGIVSIRSDNELAVLRCWRQSTKRY